MTDFTKFVDLASERLDGQVLEANDEFFASKHNLLKASKPIFIEGKYTSHGKWMDGWETRRRRTPGYDWCIIRLGLPGILHGLVVDTRHFKGNSPTHFSLEGCYLGGMSPYKNERKRVNSSSTSWSELLPQTALAGDSLNSFAIECPGRFTHLRLKIYPDGGVARLRVHGEVVSERKFNPKREIELSSAENGGYAVESSDQFFSEPLNLLMPGRAKSMGDGWETRRRRGPGHDWVIVKLGIPGRIRRIEVDTAHFKGNFPESCSAEACYVEGPAADAMLSAPSVWKEVLPRTKLGANRRHKFQRELSEVGTATHLRFNIFPDGGVSRLRIFGRPQHPNERLKGIERFNQMHAGETRKALFDCLASKKWAARVAAQGPFADAAQLYDAADRACAQLGGKDWLDAFRRHPAIGSKQAKAKQSAAVRQWSSREQSVAQQAPEKILKELARANREYLAKFGHVFLICATGKTGEEILNYLRQRLANDPKTELRIAAEEQRKITRLRLEKLLK